MNAAVTWAGEAHELRGGPIASLLSDRPRSFRHALRATQPGAQFLDQLQSLLRGAVRELTTWTGGARRARLIEQAAAASLFVREHQPEFEALYDRLADDASRGMLLALLRARVHGRPYVAPRTTDDLALLQQRVVLACVERNTRKPWEPFLHRYCLRGVHGKIVLQSDDRTLLHTLLREAYAYERDGTTIRVRPGDIVVDGGGRHGEAAVYFADLAGPTGHVYAVELEAGNAALLGENLVLNPRLRDSVTVLSRALSDRTGDAIQYRPHGPATSPVSVDQWGTLRAETPTISIDDLVEQADLARVDFIKLDLGGWERRALAGAHRTLDRFRPALAISVAHRLADLIEIPAELDRAASGYAFYLDDVSTHGDRPMLFASAPAGARWH